MRKGGTTHPFLTLQFLTDGNYDAESGLFLTAVGREKHLVASDHLEAPELRSMNADELFDAVAVHELHFDQTTQTGVVFHMISSITEHGRVGLTAVGDTPAEADEIFHHAQRVLLAEARRALREPPPTAMSLSGVPQDEGCCAWEGASVLVRMRSVTSGSQRGSHQGGAAHPHPRVGRSRSRRDRPSFFFLCRRRHTLRKPCPSACVGS